MRRNIGSRSQKVILPLCSALVRPHPEYWVLFWAPQCKKDQGIMELIQQRATKMSKSLQYLSHEERSRGLSLFRAEKECFWISDGWLCMPEQRVLRRQSQTLFRAAQCQYKWQCNWNTGGSLRPSGRTSVLLSEHHIGCPKRLWSLLLDGIQKPPGHGSGHPDTRKRRHEKLQLLLQLTEASANYKKHVHLVMRFVITGNFTRGNWCIHMILKDHPILLRT